VGGGVSALLVSIHDVAPATLPEARTWLAELDERGVPATVLVVPGPWRRPTLADDVETVTWLRAAAARDHEVALHGWDHGTGEGSPGRRAVGRLVARGADEFLSLDREQAAARLASGRRVLAEAGLDPGGFTPPGWLASRETVQAAGELGLRYLTTQASVIDLRKARRHVVPALSNRPGGWTEPVGCGLMGRLAPALARRGSVRIALHPDDLRRPATRVATLRTIDRVLATRAEPMTYLEFVERGGA
jgi:predicted deacetylase